MKTKLLVPALLLAFTTALGAQTVSEQIEGSINNLNSLVQTLESNDEAVEGDETLTHYPAARAKFLDFVREKTVEYKTCLLEIKKSNRFIELGMRGDLLNNLEDELTHQYQSCQKKLGSGLGTGIETYRSVGRRLKYASLGIFPIAAIIWRGALDGSKMRYEKLDRQCNFAAEDIFGEGNGCAGRSRSIARYRVQTTNISNLFEQCSSEIACYYLLSADWRSWYTSLRPLMVDIRLSSSVKLESLKMVRDRKINNAIESALEKATENLRLSI